MHKVSLLRGFLGLALFAHVLRAADEARPAAGSVGLPELSATPAPRFTAAQTGFVTDWLAQLAPELPETARAAAAESFLEELHRRYPDQADRLLAADFPRASHATVLLRNAAASLPGAAHVRVREQLAVRRISLLLKTDEAGAAALLGKVRDASAVQHRRVLEGRLDDDELRVLVERTQRPSEAPKPAAPAAPRELTGAELASEFARRNQDGAAVARLQAYAIEGRLKGASGETTDLLLFKMRPDRFRLVLRRDGRTLSIMAGEGDRYWVQAPGQPARPVAARDMGDRRLLAEFIDPLFGAEGYGFERLPDGEEGGRKFHRVAVRRSDGSGHVARLDPETFHETARENADGSVVRYSDHREVAGVMLAFREEIADGKGGASVLEVTRITPNPGLIADFFRPPPAGQPAYFEFEQAVRNPAGITAAAKP